VKAKAGSGWVYRWMKLAFCIAFALPLVSCGQAPAPDRTPGIAEEPQSASKSASNSTPATTAPGDRYDLERDEERGGHTLKKHVGRTDEQLMERLRRERISAASTWTDRDAAETTVAQALRAEQGRINKWEGRGYPRPNLALHYDAGRTIGRSLQRGDDHTVDCTSAVIVLRADGPDSFYVLTTYPEARQ
jgi:toxin YxiD